MISKFRVPQFASESGPSVKERSKSIDMGLGGKMKGSELDPHHDIVIAILASYLSHVRHILNLC
jgi:hypothetical protein